MVDVRLLGGEEVEVPDGKVWVVDLRSNTMENVEISDSGGTYTGTEMDAWSNMDDPVGHAGGLTLHENVDVILDDGGTSLYISGWEMDYDD